MARWPSPGQWLAAVGVALALVALGRATPAHAADRSTGPRTSSAAGPVTARSPAHQGIAPALPTAATAPVAARPNAAPVAHAVTGTVNGSVSGPISNMVNLRPAASIRGAAGSPLPPVPSPPVTTPQPAGPPNSSNPGDPAGGPKPPPP